MKNSDKEVVMDPDLEPVTVAKYIARAIASTGVRVVPVLQGGAIMQVIDEIGQCPLLSYISPNNEQALAMMVDAYARITGFGVGAVTSGPGAQNLVTGIACAYYDSIPCMFITGQVGMFHNRGTRRVRQRGFQETDIVSITASITKYSVLLDKAEEARFVFEKAVHIARTGRPGPVLIDIPFNVQRTQVIPAELLGFTPDCTADSPGITLEAAVDEVVRGLRTSRKPLVLLGGGVRLSGRADLMPGILEALGVPAVSTWCALDVLETTSPWYVGAIGRAGNMSANRAIRESDYVVALGTRFATKAIITEKNFAPKATLVAVDIDKGEMEDGLVHVHRRLNFDLGDFLPALKSRAGGHASPARNEWLSDVHALKDRCLVTDNTPPDSGFVNPYKFTKVLSEELPAESIIVGDTGTNLCWVAQAYVAKSGQRFITSWGNSPMGYALPGAIGAKLASPNSTVVAINGDGGMLMNIQELQTIVVNDIDVKIFVMNNDCYMNVKAAAVDAFAGRHFALGRGAGYHACDFVAVAQAFGIRSLRLDRNSDMRSIIREALAVPGAVVLDVVCDPEQRAWEDLDLLVPPPNPNAK